MNIVNKLTLRHLKKNKRRTLVTIIGVIISVAMVTAVSTLVTSFISLMQKHQIANEGEWHVLYKHVNEEQLHQIEADANTKKVLLSKDVGYAELPESENSYKPYLFIQGYNQDAFHHFPINIVEGKIPTKDDEVLISEHIMTDGQVEIQVGDRLTLSIGERKIKDEYLPAMEQELSDEMGTYELSQSLALQTSSDRVMETIVPKLEKTFTVVGIMERPRWEPYVAPGYTVLTYLDDEPFNVYDSVNASVVWHDINRTAVKDANDLAASLQIASPSFHNSLLRYYGVIHNDIMRKAIFSVSAIVLSIIVIGSIALIYNAFAISVSERSRYLGMLSSVGATKKQKRNSVFFEGFVIGLISIPIGVLSGLLGIWVTFYFVNPMLQDLAEISAQLTVVVTPLSIVAAVVISAITIFVSTYYPAQRASKITAIDAIRQTMDIKLTAKEVKTSKLIRKIFGIEAEIGLKNLKRNKRRYYTTIFSLVISIVLFLTVSFFTDQIKQSSSYFSSGINYDVSIRAYTPNSNENIFSNAFIESITSLEEVTDHTFIHEIAAETKLNQQQAPKELVNLREEVDTFHIGIDLKVLDHQSLREYANEVGVDFATLTNPDHITGIVVNKAITITGKYGETEAIRIDPGDKLEIIYHHWSDDESVTLGELEVLALTDHTPMGVIPNYVGSINLIISPETYALLNQDNKIKEGAYELFLTSTDPLGIHGKIEELKDHRMYIHNYHKSREEEKQFLLLVSVFVYGFIILITAISVANIFNTITTSISLRKREFGMLKSVGMTPQAFNKMIHYESIFYGLKSLLYGLPISGGIMWLIYHSMSEGFSYPFTVPWGSICITIVGIFLIVGVSMLYASAKVRKENIIDALKQENI